MSNFNFDALKKQVAALSTAIAGKQAERAAIAAEIATVNAAPASRADLKQMVFDWVDASAAQYTRGLKIAIEPFIGNWTKAPTRDNPLELLHRTMFRNTAGVHVTPGPEGLFFLLNEPIKAALSKAIDDLDLPADGMDKATRTERLKSLSSQMGQLDAELAELTDLANSAGINAQFREDLPHEREAKRLSALAEKREADEAKRRERQDSMPCGDPTDRPLSKPRPSEQSEFEKGQARIDALAANRG